MAPILIRLLRVYQIIFALGLVYFAFRLFSYHFALITFPFPNTLREGAMMTTTDALVKGLNPYAIALQPRFMNQYGIIYPLCVWPWAKLFGTTILVHRAVIAFFILASCALVYLVMARLKVPVLLNIWAVLMLYASLLYPGTSTPTIDPGATGMFFFLLTIFIPWFLEYSYQSLIISLACGLLAFYSKPYALLGALFMLPYIFLFVSKKKGLFYGLGLAAWSLISIVAVNQIFPAYFDNCFFTSVNMSGAWASMERLHEQIIAYRHLHIWILILIAAFILGYGIKYLVSLGSKQGDLFKKIISSLRYAPDYDITLVLYAGLCSCFVLYISLGRHSGAMLWYFFQLLSPFLLVGAAWLFSRHSLGPVLCAPFLIYNLYTFTLDQNYKVFDKNMPGWPQISTLISGYQRILNSSLIAPLLIEQNKDIVDDGQAEYFLPGGDRTGWMRAFLKPDDRIYIQQMLFFQNIRDAVEQKQYGLIILQPSLMPLGVADDIRKYYKYDGEMLLYVPQDRRPYAVTVWRPL